MPKKHHILVVEDELELALSQPQEAYTPQPSGLPPGGYVGPGGRGGGDMGGEGGPDMGAGPAGGYVPPGAPSPESLTTFGTRGSDLEGIDEGGPDMSGVEEALPATQYNPLTGQGYVPPGGVPEEPAPLPQGAGLADTSGGVKPTDWLKAEYKRQNPDSDSSDADIIRWAASTGTPNTEGGYEGGTQAGVGPDSNASAPLPDPNQQFGGELPGDPGGEPEDGGDEGFPGGEEERHAIPGRPPPGADRRPPPRPPEWHRRDPCPAPSATASCRRRPAGGAATGTGPRPIRDPRPGETRLPADRRRCIRSHPATGNPGIHGGTTAGFLRHSAGGRC